MVIIVLLITKEFNNLRFFEKIVMIVNISLKVIFKIFFSIEINLKNYNFSK